MNSGTYWLFLAILPTIAFLYSCVGHGGASGYLAIMVLFSFPTETMKQTALILNIFVAGVAFYQYYKAGHFNFNLFIWFALGSIPAAFLGGSILLEPSFYKKILGILLMIAILRIIFKTKNSHQIQEVNKIYAVGFGLLIGLFSGLIGIGGGILLTPLLLLLRWGNIKEVAAVSALFIFVNSVAALLGQLSLGIDFSLLTLPMIVAVLIGGTIGSYYGSTKWRFKRLEYLLIVVLGSASLKLVFF